IGITFGGDVPEYKYLCSGDSRVLCGTDDYISVYSIGGGGGGGGGGVTPGPVFLSDDYESIACIADDSSDRVMPIGPMS
ncbi:unnamed protein product, partial [Ectocarpus sp. 4 AP-2014]